jgi:L-lysine 2,3-aminomutase
MLSHWQTTLSNIVTEPKVLFDYLKLDLRYLAPAEKLSKHFPLRITYPYLEKIQKSNLKDPLLRQILPLGAEQAHIKDFNANPLYENKFNPLPGLLHKYRSRVLITISGSCAINCRYCFRREFPYKDNTLRAENWDAILEYLHLHTEVNEVIFSGGDPLILPDRALERAIQLIEKVPHITRLRIHSRLPVVIPARLDLPFLKILQASRLNVILVVHINHPQEIDLPLATALKTTQASGITLLNQSVLLRGINDDAKVLADLSEALFEAKVLPYYLHQLDQVQGSAHFTVEKKRALEIYQDLQRQLPGFLLPKYVVEEPGQHSKTLISTSIPIHSNV